MEKVEYYQVYGTIYNAPIGCLYELNGVDDEMGAIEKVKAALEKRNIKPTRAVKSESNSIEFKNGGTLVNFLHDGDFYIECVNVANSPVLNIFYDLIEGKKIKGKGIGFSDKKSFNTFFENVLKIKEYFDTIKS